MNVQSIWAGEYYAFQDYRPNKTLPMNARKGKALRVEKVRGYGRERASAYAILEVERPDGTTFEYKVRARDVIDFWDAYERERNSILKEREERAAQAKAEMQRRYEERQARLEAERKERERVARQEQERAATLVEALCKRTGLPKEVVATVGATTVNLDRQVLEFWLSTPEKDDVPTN